MDELPVVQIDHSQLGSVKLLNVYVLQCQYGASTMVPNMLASDYSVHWLRRRLVVWQLRDVRLRSDQGATVCAVARRLQSVRTEAKTIVEEAPVASHQSCGGVERWARLIGEEVRVVHCQLEQDLGGAIEEEWPVVAWLV